MPRPSVPPFPQAFAVADYRASGAAVPSPRLDRAADRGTSSRARGPTAHALIFETVAAGPCLAPAAAIGHSFAMPRSPQERPAYPEQMGAGFAGVASMNRRIGCALLFSGQTSK